MRNPTDETYSIFQKIYQVLNKELFDGTLPPCLITLQRKPSAMGYFASKGFKELFSGDETDEIALNPEAFSRFPPLEVIQTLCHEMCHLWQAHFGEPSRGGYHNRKWADKMVKIGLVPSHNGQPGGHPVGPRMSDYPDPNGKFLKVANKILQEDFTALWCDHAYSPRVAALPSQFGQVHTLGPQDLPPAAAHTLEAAIAAVWVSPSFEAKNSTQTRAKFTCPSCQDSAWGSPKLSLICGKCNQAFKRVPQTSSFQSGQTADQDDAVYARGHRRPRPGGPRRSGTRPAAVRPDVFSDPDI